MTQTKELRRELREALLELSDTIANLVNLLDGVDAAEEYSLTSDEVYAMEAREPTSSESCLEVLTK